MSKTTWLLKSEPSVYSFADLVRDQKTCWDGIANPAALKHMRSAAVGDTCIVYHTGSEKRAVGLATITRAAYAHPKTGEAVIDIAVGAALARPVTLAELKAELVFEGSPLVREGRLSFVPLTAPQFARLRQLSKTKG